MDASGARRRRRLAHVRTVCAGTTSCWWGRRSRPRPTSLPCWARSAPRRRSWCGWKRRPTRWPSASSRASRRTGRGWPRSSSTRARCLAVGGADLVLSHRGRPSGGHRRADPAGCAAVTTVLPTSLVGSYAQPNWLIDREKLAARFPPRVRARELWRVDPQWIDEAQDDATLLAIRDQERAGLDIVTDGEQRRESYSNRFANALDRHRPRQPRHRARPQRPPQPGAARGGQDRAQAPRPGRRPRVPQGEHRPPRRR